MTWLTARAAALKHDLLHNPAGWDKAIENALREAIEAAAQVAEKYSYGNGEYVCYQESDMTADIADEIRRELLGEKPEGDTGRTVTESAKE
jgi:hypothetical protein